MKKSRFTEEQIAYALRNAEAGAPVADVCRQMGISEATFYIWKKKYANLGVGELQQSITKSREAIHGAQSTPSTDPWPDPKRNAWPLKAAPESGV